jgi:hypothetical protein
VLFLVIGFLVFRVLAGMERDKVLSLICRTKPGELNLEFWMKVIAFGGIPLLGVISHLFPEVSSFLFHWVSPGLNSME